MDVEENCQRSTDPSRGLRGWEWLRHFLGLDRAVAFTILARGWTSASNLITVALIAHFLSPAEQGYYYTYASLIATLQMVFELGFSLVVMQLASHECAYLTIAPNGSITGGELSHARLASILQTSVRWYGAGALLLGLILIPTGLYFFSSHQHPGDVVRWRTPGLQLRRRQFPFQLDPLYSFLRAVDLSLVWPKCAGRKPSLEVCLRG